MGRRGPPPKPSSLKVIQGTFRPDRAAANEPKPAVKIPTAPAWLGDEAKKEWKRVTKEMAALGLISELDRTALALYCQALDEYLAACRGLDAEREYFDRHRARRADEKLLQTAVSGDAKEDEIPFPDSGLTAISSQGTRLIHPLVSIRNEAWRRVLKAAGEFGFTPSARTRVSVPEAPARAKENPFAGLRAKRA
jgi:P27 family predicted phage terminase small subunit